MKQKHPLIGKTFINKETGNQVSLDTIEHSNGHEMFCVKYEAKGASYGHTTDSFNEKFVLEENYVKPAPPSNDEWVKFSQDLEEKKPDILSPEELANPLDVLYPGNPSSDAFFPEISEQPFQ